MCKLLQLCDSRLPLSNAYVANIQSDYESCEYHIHDIHLYSASNRPSVPECQEDPILIRSDIIKLLSGVA